MHQKKIKLQRARKTLKDQLNTFHNKEMKIFLIQLKEPLAHLDTGNHHNKFIGTFKCAKMLYEFIIQFERTLSINLHTKIK